jgi:S-adenosylmethionine/arginine decarboxylase-like enzyme
LSASGATRALVPAHPDIAFRHLTADFIGVRHAQLTDPSLLSGLMIAAAGAAGFAVMGAPIVRALPHVGVGALLLLDVWHMSVDPFPDRELLLLDILTLSTHDARKALDVLTRRLTAREIRSEQRDRGRG